ncbi:radical SAM protein [Rhodovulum sulfidophilum]|uniref:radical SAM protein n=1 Tax=Rhodovulum sulfidophilum TaxID=35806 RepID=UPI001389CEA5|nr:radical SAM protein [Rhodovulum sulfidophilum]NDK36904.1 radical SAM protein [Rhodovulum sulfidophilum]
MAENQTGTDAGNRVSRLAKFTAEKFKKFDEVQRGARDDWGHDSVKVVYHKENFSNFLMGRLNEVVPITFEAWPSLSCDARCPLCTYSINNARSEDDKHPSLTFARTDLFTETMQKLASGGVRSITLTGGGEPLLNPEFGNLIKHINLAGMKWGMFTHGLHLKGQIRDAILTYPPKFLRVSLNSSSPETHAKEYRMGLQAYEDVLQNILDFARLARGLPISLGVGYAVDPKTTDDELLDIARCLRHLRDESEGRVNYASFRPKVVYYNRDGSPRYTQVRHDEFAELPSRIKECMANILGDIIASGIRLDIKHHQFHNITDRRVFTNGRALSWVSQIDHLGRGFLLSELNGSPWPGATYGSFADGTRFEDTWYSSRRLELTERYQRQELKLPLNLKTAHVDYLLDEIAERFGQFNEEQVKEFWCRPEIQRLSSPRNWDFL